MHLYVTLKAGPEMILPLTYNYFVQSMIYHTIDPELAAFLHEEGYESGTRNFKLFSFSRLSGKFHMDSVSGTIGFAGDVRLIISSPLDKFCQSIAKGLLSQENLLLSKNLVKVEKIEIRQFKADKDRLIVKTLSPVVTYSTFLRPDGRKYTCYFQPGEPDFNKLISNNLCRKFQALHGQEMPEEKVEVKALGLVKQHVVNYKDSVIKGYSGNLELKGPKELLQLALDAGLGGKNSQGFGCVIPS